MQRFLQVNYILSCIVNDRAFAVVVEKLHWQGR